jgi:LmbE family N-acetylglucosaminyl deacetylase
VPTALFLSPHLDDVAFSCGATLARLAAGGWRTVLATVFTRSVPDPDGFALECQLDKGLPPGADYMALRREEDRVFARRAGVDEVVWLNLPEAPHRGYGSAPALFLGLQDGDEIWKALLPNLADLLGRHAPDLVFAPQGLGNHADHLQAIWAVLEVGWPGDILWYRDTPYAVSEPGAPPSPLLPAGMAEASVAVTGHLGDKLDAVSAYETQLGFQFGGERAMRETLASFAAEEALRIGRDGVVEAFLTRGIGLADRTGILLS